MVDNETASYSSAIIDNYVNNLLQLKMLENIKNVNHFIWNNSLVAKSQIGT